LTSLTCEATRPMAGTQAKAGLSRRETTYRVVDIKTGKHISVYFSK
jgi:hypothetical protein